MDHVQTLIPEHPKPRENINNIYELPSIEPVIRYLHTAAGFTKNPHVSNLSAKEISHLASRHCQECNYFFPESEETHKGHMRGQRQGVRSTKPVEPTDELIDKKYDIKKENKNKILI